MAGKDTKSLIREVVREVFAEYEKRQDSERQYEQIQTRLRDYYNGAKDEPLRNAIKAIRRDQYSAIITCIFGSGMTIRETAEYLGVDSSTVTRNKKRLCLHVQKIIFDQGAEH